VEDIATPNTQDAKKQLLLIAAPVLVITLIGLVFLIYTNQPKKDSDSSPTKTATQSSQKQHSTKEAEKKDIPSEVGTYQNIKTPHFVSSTPANNAILKNGPSEVTINFNFDLGPGSKIEVLVDGNSVVAQEAKISTDKLSMTALVNPVEPGHYQVKYTACWPDGSCHDGSFGFSVN
jgi:methionine-rich copper-binding protein CopC